MRFLFSLSNNWVEWLFAFRLQNTNIANTFASQHHTQISLEIMKGTSIPMTFWEKYDPACHHWSTQQAAETTKCCLNLFQADKVQRGYWLRPTQIKKINRGSEEVFITVIIDSWTMTKCSWLTATIQSFVFISCFLPYHSHPVACKESVGRILDYKHIEFNESKWLFFFL